MKRTLDYNKAFKLKGRKYKAHIREVRAINKATASIRNDLKRSMRLEGVRIQEIKTSID